jgi:hypothetical protein
MIYTKGRHRDDRIDEILGTAIVGKCTNRRVGGNGKGANFPTRRSNRFGNASDQIGRKRHSWTDNHEMHNPEPTV